MRARIVLLVSTTTALNSKNAKCVLKVNIKTNYKDQLAKVSLIIKSFAVFILTIFLLYFLLLYLLKRLCCRKVWR